MREREGGCIGRKTKEQEEEEEVKDELDDI